MYLLGYDLGSSSVKASLVSIETGVCIASAFSPKEEMPMLASQAGWAEQEPDMWWKNIVAATQECLEASNVHKDSIAAIGISYQMHGLVIIDKDGKPLRPSIIWCDSRAVSIGADAFKSIGQERCLASMLNSPGNFTASKLKWVKDHEPAVYDQIYQAMLPGDYIAFLMTGEARTTPSGLSEGILWDFRKHNLSEVIMDTYGFDRSMFPEIVENFSLQGHLTSRAANELGLKTGTPVAYRGGDQPNNAFSLNVLNPGEIAATAGTSGVVYGVSDQVKYDPLSRVNTFAHVNHSVNNPRMGVLLCVNGTGIANSWLKKSLGEGNLTYDQMNQLAEKVNPGADRLVVLPFGNGAERMLENKDPGCTIDGLDFNRHDRGTLIRATQEGIVFSLHYGMEIMKTTGIVPTVIRAGHSNMFLSPLFRNTLAAITGATIELYNTDGSQGAARAAGLGAEIYQNAEEAFRGLKIIQTIEPDPKLAEVLQEAYKRWKELLEVKLKG